MATKFAPTYEEHGIPLKCAICGAPLLIDEDLVFVDNRLCCAECGEHNEKKEGLKKDGRKERNV